MQKNTTINIRVDSVMKELAGKVLEQLGLTFSEAFNLLLHQVHLQQALPFSLIAYSEIPKPELREYLDRVARGEEESQTFDTWAQAKECGVD